MRLYAGTSKQFIEDTVQNQIAEKLKRSFHDYYGRQVSPGEYTSWNNSLQFVKSAIQENALLDNMIILEYEIPYSTNRIDCLLFGKGRDSEDNVVVIELKQWSSVDDSEIEGNILTFVGGAKRMEPHPCIQVRGYHFFLKDFIQVFEEQGMDLYSCAYCHNYSRDGDAVLFRQKFQDILKDFPLFAKEDFSQLGEYLKEKLEKGKGLDIFNRFSNSPITPSKKLLEHTRSTMEGNQAFTLIDEQITAYNTIVDRAKKIASLNKKSVIIVQGGPGTGKSVIALNVLAELLKKGHKVYHATGSAAFTSTLRKIVGARIANLFKYFNSFATAKENDLDVLICDEAHRIRKTSNNRYTKAEFRTDLPQIDELLKVAKLCIFFIDDYQGVRPDEIGSTDMIKKHAEKLGAEIFEFELKTQFRCSGSDGYLLWVDNTLGVRETANRILDKSEKMDFKIFNSPKALYEAIQEKNKEKPNSARMAAGFCWQWSDTKPDGTLVEDVVIGDFRMTWEAKSDSKKVAPGVVKASLWAYDPNGVSQCGSIYTIQGFEFEYVGVIFGRDLVYNPEKSEWIGKKENSADSMVKKASDEEFTRFIKNVYRVLLTRGMKGCYVYFLDKNTENFFTSRIEF
jgi:DUF2075 family protein